MRDDDPSLQVSRPKNIAKKSRSDFSDGELRTLLSGVPKNSDEAWLIRLAVYTVMREGELAQPRKNDVRKSEDVWVVDVNARDDQ